MLRRQLAAERDEEIAAVVARLEEDALAKEAQLQARNGGACVCNLLHGSWGAGSSSASVSSPTEAPPASMHPASRSSWRRGRRQPRHAGGSGWTGPRQGRHAWQVSN